MIRRVLFDLLGISLLIVFYLLLKPGLVSFEDIDLMDIPLSYITIGTILNGWMAFYIWKNIWYNMEKEQIFPDWRFILLVVIICFFVILNLSVFRWLLFLLFLNFQIEGGNIGGYYTNPFLLIPYIFLILFFWKWYNLKLAKKKIGACGERFHIVRLLTLGMVLPILVLGSLIVFSSFFYLIFYRVIF